MKKLKIYVASSWRNEIQPSVVEYLRTMGFEVYDFKNPEPNCTGFKWDEIDPDWKSWNTAEYTNALKHPIAIKGFERDFNAMKEADVCVMVLPCGASAHTEAGWMKGQGKPTFVLAETLKEAELMYKIYDCCTDSLGHIYSRLKNIEEKLVENL